MIDHIFHSIRGTLNDYKERTLNDYKEHTEFINKVYKLLILVRLEQGRLPKPRQYHLKFPKEYKSQLTQFRERLWKDKQFVELYEDQLKSEPAYLYYEPAIEHLKHKKYKHIYRHWENTKKLLDEFNGNVKEKHSEQPHFYITNPSKCDNISKELAAFKDELEQLIIKLEKKPLINGKCRWCP